MEQEPEDFLELVGKEWKPDLVKNIEEDREKYKNLPDYYTKAVDDAVKEGRWAVSDSGKIWSNAPNTANQLPSGIYSGGITMSGEVYLSRKSITTDELVELPDDPTTEVLEHFEDFWSREEKFREYGFVFKRGVLVYGPQGGGKSSTVYRLINRIVNEKEGIVLLADSPRVASAAIDLVRELEPSRPILVVMEDVDDIVYYYGDRQLTKLLDGGENVDNVIFLATTNYPERLPPRLLQRPSRFDIVMYIGMPSADDRRVYISTILNNMLLGVSDYVEATAGLSIAQIKEVILLTQVFEIDLEEAVRRVKTLGKNLVQSIV